MDTLSFREYLNKEINKLKDKRKPVKEKKKQFKDIRYIANLKQG